MNDKYCIEKERININDKYCIEKERINMTQESWLGSGSLSITASRRGGHFSFRVI